MEFLAFFTLLFTPIFMIAPIMNAGVHKQQYFGDYVKHCVWVNTKCFWTVMAFWAAGEFIQRFTREMMNVYPDKTYYFNLLSIAEALAIELILSLIFSLVGWLLYKHNWKHFLQSGSKEKGIRYVFYCEKCDSIDLFYCYSDRIPTCHHCRKQMYSTGMTDKELAATPVDEVINLMAQWRHRPKEPVPIETLHERSREYNEENNIKTPDVKRKVVKEVEEKPKVETGFRCSKCGKEFTGWYQKCSNCGAMNSMVKFERAIGSESETSEMLNSKEVEAKSINDFHDEKPTGEAIFDMNDKNKGKIIVASIIAILILGLAAISILYFVQKNESQKRITELTTEIDQLNDVLSLEATAKNELTAENETLKTRNAKLNKDSNILNKITSYLSSKKATMYKDDSTYCANTNIIFVQKGETEKVTITVKIEGELVVYYKMLYLSDYYYPENYQDKVSCEWGDWYSNGEKIDLTVTGEQVGTQLIKFTNNSTDTTFYVLAVCYE